MKRKAKEPARVTPAEEQLLRRERLKVSLCFLVDQMTEPEVRKLSGRNLQDWADMLYELGAKRK